MLWSSHFHHRFLISILKYHRNDKDSPQVNKDDALATRSTEVTFIDRPELVLQAFFIFLFFHRMEILESKGKQETIVIKRFWECGTY